MTEICCLSYISLKSGIPIVLGIGSSPRCGPKIDSSPLVSGSIFTERELPLLELELPLRELELPLLELELPLLELELPLLDGLFAGLLN